MKIYIRNAVFILAFASSSISASQALGVMREPQAPLIVHSEAHPNNVHVPSATHHFKLQVAGYNISKLLIDLPKGISVTGGIEITSQSGQKVDYTVSLNNRRVTVAFAQPVSPGTTLSISLKGVRTSDYLGRTWLYPVSGRLNDIQVDIPLGIARIQTYK